MWFERKMTSLERLWNNLWSLIQRKTSLINDKKYYVIFEKKTNLLIRNILTYIHPYILHQDCQKQPTEVFYRKSVLTNLTKFPGKHLCQGLFFNKVAVSACIFNKKGSLAQVFSCKYCKIFMNTYFIEHLWTTASGLYDTVKSHNPEKTLSRAKYCFRCLSTTLWDV